MRLSKNSKQLMMFLTKNKGINHQTFTKKTDSIITELYKDILEAYNYLLNIKRLKSQYYSVKTKKVLSATQITKPQIFNSNSFPEVVRNHIDEMTMSEITYSFKIFDRNIKVHFILEESNIELKLATFNKYLDAIIMWLYILNQYASKTCSNTLVIYFYFTGLEKHLPQSNISILDEINVNTAFTTTCPKDSEIVVFRREEWFKVFIHETFHNFGLDFSDMNTEQVTNQILSLFKVNSKVNLFESYAEFWAEIMNALFCSFIELKNKNDVAEFLNNAEFFINFERSYSFLQLVKTLNFMGLSYMDLYSNTDHSKTLRDNLYKEKTNVLSYYIIKTILMNNFQSFLAWCENNNFSLLQFKKTNANQIAYYKFIERYYKSSSMLQNIQSTQVFLGKISKKNTNINNYVLSNLRMSICELG
jgi:hypothetical protein